jgi:hypothetical protein
MPMELVSAPIHLDVIRHAAREQFGECDGQPGTAFIEFDSMINVRPAHGNRSRGVADAAVRQRIDEIVARLVLR